MILREKKENLEMVKTGDVGIDGTCLGQLIAIYFLG